ncbi:LolA family protein [Streptomyces sedi]|uniref:DUF2092 domain-containing protein n=1 Tax=Streptomyces sedi TaxID=555059 RepID=A0A5C4UY77_9ACTN|nr:sigma-E factor regulatory protein RseB domain-containing protein [Streptomyces sedi]TNM28517.1 DUF2092 domain-containing protein [Streptomyces sedi]
MAMQENIRRAGLPVAVLAGVAAIGVGVWPALASDGSPDLPEMTAEELVVLVAESDTAQLSGTVRVESDLGVPDMGGLAEGVLGGLDGPAGRLASLAAGESTLRVAMDGPDRQRLALVDGPDEFAVIHNGDQLWAYDSTENVVFRADLADVEGQTSDEGETEAWMGDLTPQEAAERLLAEADRDAEIAMDGTGRVAGRDVYQLSIEPRDENIPLASARISVDAETGVPLAARAESTGGQTVDVAFSQVDFAVPAGGAFEFSPPEGAEVLEADPNEPFGGLLEELLPGAVPGDLPQIDPGELRDELPEELLNELPREELAETRDEVSGELPELAELIDALIR